MLIRTRHSDRYLKHKAFLTTWVIETLSEPHNVLTFFCEDISDYVFAMMYFEE